MIYQKKILSLNVVLRRYGIICDVNNKYEIINGFLDSLKTKAKENIPAEVVHETPKTVYSGIGL